MKNMIIFFIIFIFIIFTCFSNKNGSYIEKKDLIFINDSSEYKVRNDLLKNISNIDSILLLCISIENKYMLKNSCKNKSLIFIEEEYNNLDDEVKLSLNKRLKDLNIKFILSNYNEYIFDDRKCNKLITINIEVINSVTGKKV